MSNTGRLYSNLDKILIGCILSLGKIRAGVFQFYRFQVNPVGLERLFSELFLFLQKNKILASLLLNFVCI